MPNQPNPELIPEFVDTQLPAGSRVRFCFDEPLMSSDAPDCFCLPVMLQLAVTSHVSPLPLLLG